MFPLNWNELWWETRMIFLLMLMIFLNWKCITGERDNSIIIVDEAMAVFA